MLAAAVLARAEPEGPSFAGVGDAPGGAFLSRALGVSPNGEWVVGASEVEAANAESPPKTEAFRWHSGEMETLGRNALFQMPRMVEFLGEYVYRRYGGGRSSEAVAVSDDGAVAVGKVCETPDTWNCPGIMPAYDCTCASAVFTNGHVFAVQFHDYLGTGYGFFSRSEALDVSADGKRFLLVEYSSVDLDDYGDLVVRDRSTLTNAFHQGGVFVSFAGGAIDESGAAVTARFGDPLSGTQETVLWPSLTQVDLDVPNDLAGPGFEIAGRKNGQAALWQSGATTLLGDLPDGSSDSDALGVSRGGRAVVGWGTTALGQEAFVWTPQRGMRRLADVLVEAGLDLTGWTLRQATGISASGRTIVGWGVNPNGDTEGFVARLAAEPAAVPALSGAGLALLGAALLLTALSAVARGRRA